jgi:hypothetical protein
MLTSVPTHIHGSGGYLTNSQYHRKARALKLAVDLGGMSMIVLRRSQIFIGSRNLGESYLMITTPISESDPAAVKELELYLDHE